MKTTKAFEEYYRNAKGFGCRDYSDYIAIKKVAFRAWRAGRKNERERNHNHRRGEAE